MSDITGSGSLQFWQGIAAVIGASLGGFFLALGRRSGGVASRAPEANPSGDALQREILAETRALVTEVRSLVTETRGLRGDWQAKREADEERRRDLRERSVDEQLDDIRRTLNINRVGQNDIKHVLGHVMDRLPASERPRLPAPDDRGLAAES